MENFSYSSYPDSSHSSPRSREIDCENASWDDTSSNNNYKVKFMCSYGGKIHPRPHDNQLAYVGGETKIFAVDRNIRFSGIITKLSALCDTEVCFKYQLPGEDLDALISVTNDEDLEHMMLEYDRLYRGSAKPARLRLFLFELNTPGSFAPPPSDPTPDRQWFVDALNSAPIQAIEASSPPGTAANPDFLFGFDKGAAGAVAQQAPAAKLQDPAPEQAIPDTSPTGTVRSDISKEDRYIGGEAVVSPAEIQRQIHELQRLQIANQEQAVFQRMMEENVPRVPPGDYYMQKVQEKPAPVPAPVLSQVSVQAPIPGTYWQERPMAGYTSAAGGEQPVYMVQAPAPAHAPAPASAHVHAPAPVGVYQQAGMRPASQVGQGYYAIPRMAPEVYREPAVYGVGPTQPPPKVAAYTEAVGGVRPPPPDTGYAQMAYDSSGRQVFYTAPGGVVPTYQPVTAASVDMRQTIRPENSKVARPAPAS